MIVHESWEGFWASLLVLMIIKTYRSRAWRVCCVTYGGMRASGMADVHLVCLRANNKSPYVAVLKISKVRVDE